MYNRPSHPITAEIKLSLKAELPLNTMYPYKNNDPWTLPTKKYFKDICDFVRWWTCVRDTQIWCRWMSLPFWQLSNNFDTEGLLTSCSNDKVFSLYRYVWVCGEFYLHLLGRWLSTTVCTVTWQPNFWIDSILAGILLGISALVLQEKVIMRIVAIY